MSLLDENNSKPEELHEPSDPIYDSTDDYVDPSSSRTRQWLRRLAAPITLVVALGAVYLVKDKGESNPATSPVPASTAPTTQPPTTLPKQLLVNNVCNVVANTGVDKLLSNKVGNQITRQCVSVPTNGIISDGFWAYDSGLTVDVAVLDDSVLSQTATTPSDGPNNLVSFDTFSSTQAVTHFNVTTPSGHEYQAAASHDSIRLRTGSFVLAITFGEAKPQPGHEAFVAPDLGNNIPAGMTEFSGTLADSVFSYS